MGSSAIWSRGQAIHWREEMKKTHIPASVVRFGAFEVNLQSRELRKHGTRMRLEEKPFQILEMLLECAGDVITRRTLRERLWPDTHVAYEHGLNTAVNKLRDLLGDSAQRPRFVETLPRRGYRFIAPVVKRGENTEQGPPSRAPI
jgi:DNA-binding winged helix-turn-helix (wHTH) protein